jgi:hypothetical protein
MGRIVPATSSEGRGTSRPVISFLMQGHGSASARTSGTGPLQGGDMSRSESRRALVEPLEGRWRAAGGPHAALDHCEQRRIRRIQSRRHARAPPRLTLEIPERRG